MLTCLRDHAISYLQNAAGLQLATTDVLYCLSVPAGWSDAAKDVMRRCAHAAGMTLRSPNGSSSSSRESLRSSATGLSLDSLRLTNGRDQWECVSEASFESYAEDAGGAVVLVHEQEAAALMACVDPHKAIAGLKAVPGDVWVVLDAGGGTVDIAMHGWVGLFEIVNLLPNKSVDILVTCNRCAGNLQVCGFYLAGCAALVLQETHRLFPSMSVLRFNAWLEYVICTSYLVSQCVADQGCGCGRSRLWVWPIKAVGVADQGCGCGRSRLWVWPIKAVGVADQGCGCGRSRAMCGWCWMLGVAPWTSQHTGVQGSLALHTLCPLRALPGTQMIPPVCTIAMLPWSPSS
jgi:hypothetical protein